jgi:hypothetical protein
MSDAAHELAQLVGAELAREAPEPARRLAAAIRERVGPGAGAVLFYGSCLRRATAEGVFDFYVLVDDYRRANLSAGLAWASQRLPPSVFYLELPAAPAPLRAKYALISLRDFARGAAPGGFRTGIWARFCQPSVAVFARDREAHEAAAQACAAAVLTAVVTVTPLLEHPVTPAEFWRAVFAQTYRCEMRPESPAAVESLVAADPARYERVLRVALAVLEARGALRVEWDAGRFSPAQSAGAGARARRAWRRHVPLAKLAYVAQLFKTAFTFGDWLPYALWKLERHTGSRIPYTERQRRHPLIFGWPLLFRVLRGGLLR